MQLQKILSKNVIDAFDKLFNVGVKNIEFQPTKKEFEGDITIVIFPFVKLLKQNPKDIAEKLGSYLEKQDYVVKYNVVSGFLNLVISDEYYLDFLNKPNNENTSAMCLAANLSGEAINISKTTAPHSLSYPFTAYYNISHGHAVSLTLNKCLNFNQGVHTCLIITS